MKRKGFPMKSPMKQEKHSDYESEEEKTGPGWRETSWWKGEEGWIPDEWQDGVKRPKVRTSTGKQMDSRMSIANFEQAQEDYKTEYEAWEKGGREGPEPISLDERLIKKDGQYWNSRTGWNKETGKPNIK